MISRRKLFLGAAATLLASPALASSRYEWGKSLENLVASTFEERVPLSNSDWTRIQGNISDLVYDKCELPDHIFDHIVEEYRDWYDIDRRHFNECGTCYRLLIECTRNVIHEDHHQFPRSRSGQGVIYNGVKYRAKECARLQDEFGEELDIYIYKDKIAGYQVINQQGVKQPHDDIIG